MTRINESEAASPAPEREEYTIPDFPLLRDALPAVLSPAEREVMALILAGHSVPKVAQLRQRSPHTVANQVRCIYAKLGIRSRGELAVVQQAVNPQ